jgi:hypothetical protein
MRDHAVPATTTEPSATPGTAHCGAPSRTKRQRPRLGRLVSKTGLAAAAAVAALAVTTAGAAGAHASEPLANGPTVQLSTYNIPASAPAYQNGGDLLPAYNGTLGNAVNIFMTGQSNNYTSNNTYALGIPGASTTWGTQVSTGAYTGAASQEWFFQRIGYVGVTIPTTAGRSVDGTPVDLAVPVYRILNYNPSDPGVGFTCLESASESGAAGSIVESSNCNPNPPAQTPGNQLWVVGSPKQTNDIIYTTTGAFVPPPSTFAQPQVYSEPLQSNPPIQLAANSLENSVIENVASLWNNGWNTYAAPVLSATYTNMPGINSGLQLAAQAFPATYGNSTWNLVPGYAPAAPPTNNPDNTCSGLSGYSVLMCA